jgi:hypothetical protein
LQARSRPFVAPFANLKLAQETRRKIRVTYDSPDDFCVSFCRFWLSVSARFAGPAAPQNCADNGNGQKNQRQKLANPHLDGKQVSAAVDTGPVSWIASETRLQSAVAVVADAESPIVFDDEQRPWLRHGCECQQTEHQQKDKPDVRHMRSAYDAEFEADSEAHNRRARRKQRKSE